MRKLIGILVCLLAAASVFAVEYHPLRVSAAARDGYYSAASAPSVGFRSTSAYSPNSANSIASNSVSGLSAISASNFAALNSEDGLFAETSAKVGAIRKSGRPGGGGGSEGGGIGEYDFHSPVGDLPFLFFVLLLAAHACRANKRLKVGR